MLGLRPGPCKNVARIGELRIVWKRLSVGQRGLG